MPLRPGRNLKLRKLKAFSEAVHALYRPVTPTDFQRQVVAALESFFGSELVAYNEFHAGRPPLVVDNADLHKNRPMMDAFSRYMTQNPLIAKLLREKSVPGSRLTDALPFAEFKKTHIYNEFYHPIGGDFQLGCGFLTADSRGHVGVAMNQKLRDFTDEELYLFELFVPHLEQAYHQNRALELARGERGAITGALDGHNTGLIVFDDSYRVVALAGVALRLAWILFSCRPQEGCLLPEDIRECARHLQGARKDARPGPPGPLTYALEDGGTVTLRLSRDSECVNHGLLLEWKRGALSLNRLRALGLNIEETEVVHGILHRRPIGAIAAARAMSAEAVESHLASTMRQLQVNDVSEIPKRVEELLL